MKECNLVEVLLTKQDEKEVLKEIEEMDQEF